MTTLSAAPLAPLLDRMFAEAEAPAPPQARAALAQLTPEERNRLSASTEEADYRTFYGLARDAYLAVSRDTARLLYMLARASGARSVVEFGTSFGVSTLHLAAGLRDNGGGRIITTEFEPSKAARARENFAVGGLADLIELREGDALQTLPRPARADRPRLARRRQEPLPGSPDASRRTSATRRAHHCRQRRPEPRIPAPRPIRHQRVHLSAVRRGCRTLDAHRLT